MRFFALFPATVCECPPLRESLRGASANEQFFVTFFEAPRPRPRPLFFVFCPPTTRLVQPCSTPNKHFSQRLKPVQKDSSFLDVPVSPPPRSFLSCLPSPRNPDGRVRSLGAWRAIPNPQALSVLTQKPTDSRVVCEQRRGGGVPVVRREAAVDGRRLEGRPGKHVAVVLGLRGSKQVCLNKFVVGGMLAMCFRVGWAISTQVLGSCRSGSPGQHPLFFVGSAGPPHTHTTRCWRGDSPTSDVVVSGRLNPTTNVCRSRRPNVSILLRSKPAT